MNDTSREIAAAVAPLNPQFICVAGSGVPSFTGQCLGANGGAAIY